MKRRKVGGMQKDKNTNSLPPDMPGRQDWRDRIKADFAAQVKAGGTLYGIRPDGTWSARARDGVRVIKRRDRKSA